MTRLRVDPLRCRGHGICVLRAPDRIELDDWGFAELDGRPLVGSVQLRQARRAVAACPARALAFDESAPA